MNQKLREERGQLLVAAGSSFDNSQIHPLLVTSHVALLPVGLRNARPGSQANHPKN